MTLPVAVLHLDESCLGNGREGGTPGGAAGLVEIRARGGVERRDFRHHDPDTTNNRMALTGARLALELLAAKGRRLRLLAVSDSEYLVKGMREWVPGWRARGWRRKGGAIENLEMWQSLVAAADRHDVQWTWVRGHVGHPKNEYADHLAVRAAGEGTGSNGLEPSGFLAWLAARQSKGQYAGYDPDTDYAHLAGLAGAAVPLRL
ncbi:MAG TPA: ribonuclease H [Gemmatimonadales bacterium]|nr:ribonuclease H [Gemmatimonadales bacterium]